MTAPTFNAVPVFRRRTRYILGSGAPYMTGASLLFTFMAVSAGGSTGTAVLALLAAARIRRIALYAPLDTAGLPARAILNVRGAGFGPNRTIEAISTSAQQVPAVYVPEAHEFVGEWINWSATNGANGQLNKTLFNCEGTDFVGAMVDVDIEFTLDRALFEQIGFATATGATTSGIYAGALDQFADGSNNAGSQVCLQEGQSSLATGAYTVA